MSRAWGRFPQTRLRRNRRDAWSRALVSEARLGSEDLIWPVFVREGDGDDEEILSMPGVQRLGVERLVERVGRARELGVPAVALFPVVDPGGQD